MRVDLDAKVRTGDGQEAGSVQRAIVDPETNEVTGFIISTGGLLGHDVIVPREQIEKASRDGDVIVLGLTKEEVDNLPAYAPAIYTAPPTEWRHPTGYYLPPSGYLWPITFPLPKEEGPLLASRGVEEDLHRAEPVPAVNKGAVVLDRDGDDIGVVDDMRFDPQSGHLTGLIVRLGGALRTLFGGRETAVGRRPPDKTRGGRRGSPSAGKQRRLETG